MLYQNRYGVVGNLFGVKNLNALHDMKEDVDDVMVASGPVKLEIHTPAERGKYKGVHRIKLEVQIPKDALTEGATLFDKKLGVVLRLPREAVAEDLRPELFTAKHYAVEREDGERVRFDSKKELEAGLESLWSTFGEIGKPLAYNKGRVGPAVVTGEIAKYLEDLPFELIDIFTQWGRNTIRGEMEDTDMQVLLALIEQRDKAEEYKVNETV